MKIDKRKPAAVAAIVFFFLSLSALAAEGAGLSDSGAVAEDEAASAARPASDTLGASEGEGAVDPGRPGVGESVDGEASESPEGSGIAENRDPPLTDKKPTAPKEDDKASSPGKPPPHPEDGFGFGTYGRIQASSDFEGRKGRDTNVVTHGARLMEEMYLELDFKYAIHTDDDFGVRMVATVAFFDEIFHYTGKAEQAVTLRNLYAEAENFLPTDLKLWIGARMYRGDDIYLLDYWPLDNLNTYGGGLSWNGYGLELKWHIGVNRLDNEYQIQRLNVPSTFASDEITIMERQKTITSFKATYHLFELVDEFSMKFSLYAEYHHLPSGEYKYSEKHADYLENFAITGNPGLSTDLPADRGYVIGGQVGLWGFGENTHLNLFFRYADGLAAYGEWAVPWGVNLDRRAEGAKEFVMAASFNWESHWVGVMAGWYVRMFKDADRNRIDLDDYWEGITTVRPGIFITRHFHQLFEIAHQWKYPHGLGPHDEKHHVPHVWQLSVIPALSLDRGMYQRPQFRLVYTASHLNYDARNLFPAWDARRDSPWRHFFGAQVEWWFDSESYMNK